jgi:adenylate cyclase
MTTDAHHPDNNTGHNTEHGGGGEEPGGDGSASAATEAVHGLADAGSAATRRRRLTHLLLGQEPRYTSAQAAALAGVDLDQAADLWRFLGFATPDPGEVMFTDSDIQALRIAEGLRDSSVNLQLPVARAVGQSMARMTEWQADLLRELSTAGRASTPGHHEYRGDRAVEATFAVLLPTWERLQQHVWHRHLLAAIERLVSQPGHTSSEAPTVIGFADIADYTSTSRGLTPAKLEDYIENFTADASLIITDRGGRVIKTIGDEIMFAVDDPEAGAEIALALADRPSELDGRPELHIGLAYGPVLRHLGDYYGTTVNLASRLTSLARPGTVLIDHHLATALQDNPQLQTHRLKPIALRGFPQLHPWLLRPTHTHPTLGPT